VTITLAEIDRWDPETLDQVFDRCQRIGGECVRLDDELGDLSKLDRWGGEAAEAARISIGKVRVDVGDLMAQSFHIRRAVDSAQSEIEAVKLRLEAARQTAIGDALSISPEGIVSEDTAKSPDMSDWTLRRIENFMVQKAAPTETSDQRTPGPPSTSTTKTGLSSRVRPPRFKQMGKSRSANRVHKRGNCPTGQ
jgi:hypothetical protein